MAELDADGRQLAPRIAPVAEPTDEQAEILDKTHRGQGPANIFATMAHNPRLLKRLNVLGGYFMAHGTIPARSREIVVLRAAHRTGCDYEFGRHTLVVQREKLLTEDELRQLTTDPLQGDWAEDERDLVRLADEITVDDVVGPELWDRLSGRHDDEQLIELVMLVGFYRMLAGFLNSVQVNREHDVPGWPA